VAATWNDKVANGRVCQKWANEEVLVADPKLVLTVGEPPCTLLHNISQYDLDLQGQVYQILVGHLLPAGTRTVEVNIQKNGPLMGTKPGPTTPDGTSTPVYGPAPITRSAPWAAYHVFHLVHPQAVMMAQTGVTTAQLQAISLSLGAKSNGMNLAQLYRARDQYLSRHSVAELLGLLPLGPQADYAMNVTSLKRHAVALANLADVLHDMKLTTGKRADDVLRDQATQMVDRFRMAASITALYDELRALRRQRNDAFTKLSR
jgi:hypothetical protein